MKFKKYASLFGVVFLLLSLIGCGANTEQSVEKGKKPKYVFLFIGDGMSYPQFQLAADYLGAMADEDYMGALPSLSYEQRTSTLDGPEELNFMNFETTGTAVTFDSSSFAPDSAAAGTAIATGKKTYSNTINMDETHTIPYESIAEKIHRQLGWKVGIVSSVNVNHATPAAFYAHQPFRTNYYDIGVELVNSGFSYFAGGGFRNIYGEAGNMQNIYEVAAAGGYRIAMTEEEAEAIGPGSDKVILIGEHLADSDALEYAVDREEGTWALADYVKKGIEVLENDKGFFMMCEGGKIDWACHANDGGTVINEVLDLADAVQVAIDFAKEHPKDTLIVVTGDHETGGLSIGFAGTDYDTYLTNYEKQKISFQKYEDEYISNYVENGTDFEAAMKDVEELFGLKMTGKPDDLLVLTAYEIGLLAEAYGVSIRNLDREYYTQEQDILYGTYDPFTVTITRILNNKSGVNFSSDNHTGLPIAIFATGAGADIFDGYYDNTDIFYKLAELVGVK